MTFDLFADEPVPAPPPAAAPAPVRESFMMQPTGEPNRWRYRDVHLLCDMPRKGYTDHWRTVEPLDGQIRKSDSRVQLCRAIDAHLGGRQDQSSPNGGSR